MVNSILFSRVFTLKLIPHIISMGLILFSSVSYGAENARITFKIHEVPIADEIETQIYVSWGPQKRNVPASWLQRHNFRNSAGRRTGTIEHRTKTMQIDSEVTSFLIYGRIISTTKAKTIRFIPAKYFKTKDYRSLNQVVIDIIPRKTFDEALLDSYPLEFRSDTGFLNVENVRPTLRSFRLMFDYAGETDSEISKDVYNRIHTFFKVNRSFFKKGGSRELSEILEYLKTYVAVSRAPGVAKFYAEFLNGLIGIVSGTEVFDKDITDYLHGQLTQLYEERMGEVFEQADISLQRFHNIKRNGSCITLAEKILRALDEDMLEKVRENSPRNLNSVLLQTTVCGQYHYEIDSGEEHANHKARSNGARFLASSEIGRPTISEFHRICEFMQSKGLLSISSTGKLAEIAKYCIDYNQALIGGY